jgi:DNA-binding response OmpR family regulator
MVEGARVLVVDDEPMVRDVLARYLSKGGFDVELAADGQAAIDAFNRRRPDLVLLDLMLPRIEGLEVFRLIRSRTQSPVIMLTARGAETDRVVGLEMGADDYVAKPFSPSEVVARVRAVLRRVGERDSTGVTGADPPTITAGSLEIDPGAHEASQNGSPLSLTPKEFDLLLFLASNPRQAFSRVQLLEEVWDLASTADPSTVTVHVRRLREKIEPDPSSPRTLVTIWGVGYRFEA